MNMSVATVTHGVSQSVYMCIGYSVCVCARVSAYVCVCVCVCVC